MLNTFKRNGHSYDLVGEKFGKLLVIKKSDKITKDGTLKWECLCDCGNTKHVRTSGLLKKYGSTLSCGCLSVQHCKNLGIKQRKENHSRWKGYGEIHGNYWNIIKKGAHSRNLEITITIQEAWELFLKQERKCVISGIDLFFPETWTGDGRNKGNASLDRIDSTKGYTKDNCQWVDKNINISKWELDDKRFLELCQLVVDYHNKTKE